MVETTKHHAQASRSGNICGSCNKEVGLRDEDIALQCKVCEFWHHITCETMDDESYRVLAKETLNLH